MNQLDFLKESLQIASVSGDEKAFADFLLQHMKDCGFLAWKDKVGNVIGEIGKGAPVILFASHMDTVSGVIPVKLTDQKLFGRGAVDAKGSLCAMVSAAARFVGREIPGKIIVAGIVEEETTSRGINSLLETINHADFAIFGEPSGLNRICIASKGRIHLHVQFKIRSGQAHVSAGNVENPIHIAVQFWNELESIFNEKPFKGKTLYYSVEPNITIIKGGIATNILPDACEIDLDIRFPFGMKSERITEKIEEIVSGFRKYPSMQVKDTILSEIQGFRAPKDSRVALTLKQACETVLGGSVTFLRKAGTNFMVFLADRYQIPVVSYGPGNPSLGHTSTENIEVDEYLKSIDVLEKFVQIILFD